MKKTQYLGLICLLAGSVAAYAQTPAKGDAAKGKAVFDTNCSLCHSTGADQKMGPGFKGLYKKAKLASTGKPVTDANVIEKINAGGAAMPPMKDVLSDADRANVIAYLKTL
jgi:mono/diheme cytochrome c family protein